MLYFAKDISNVEQFEKFCKINGLEPKKVIFIFPGSISHHTGGTTPLTIKTGSGLANVAHQLGNAGYPTLSLPIHDVEQWRSDEEQNRIVDSAIIELYRALGEGYNFVLPVRDQGELTYFSKGKGLILKPGLEPDFQPGAGKEPDKMLNDYYLKALNIFHNIASSSDSERKFWMKGDETPQIKAYKEGLEKRNTEQSTTPKPAVKRSTKIGGWDQSDTESDEYDTYEYETESEDNPINAKPATKTAAKPTTKSAAKPAAKSPARTTYISQATSTTTDSDDEDSDDSDDYDAESQEAAAPESSYKPNDTKSSGTAKVPSSVAVFDDETSYEYDLGSDDDPLVPKSSQKPAAPQTTRSAKAPAAANNDEDSYTYSESEDSPVTKKPTQKPTASKPTKPAATAANVDDEDSSEYTYESYYTYSDSEDSSLTTKPTQSPADSQPAKPSAVAANVFEEDSSEYTDESYSDSAVSPVTTKPTQNPAASKLTKPLKEVLDFDEEGSDDDSLYEQNSTDSDQNGSLDKARQNPTSIQTFPKSYSRIYDQKSDPVIAAKALLNDYTKNNSYLNRLVHFHANRHHAKPVNEIVQNKQLDSIDKILAALKEIKNINPEGSLARRIAFLEMRNPEVSSEQQQNITNMPTPP